MAQSNSQREDDQDLEQPAVPNRSIPLPQRSSGLPWWSRYLSLWLLRLELPLATASAAMAVTVLIQTLGLSWRTYVKLENAPAFFDANASPFQRVIAADLSGMSAFIVLATSVLAAAHSWSNRKLIYCPPIDFRQKAYTFRVFSEGTGRYLVQCGVLGTFWAFSLIAFGAPAILASGENAVMRIMLMLFAATVSTLTGIFFSVVVIPALEAVNACAMGRHQLPRVDSEHARDQFDVALVGGAEGLEQFKDSLNDIVQSAGLFKAVPPTLQAVTGQIAELNRKIDRGEERAGLLVGRLEVVSERLGTVAGKLDLAIDDVSAMTKTMDDAARGLSRAAGEIVQALRTLLKPVRLISEVATKSCEILAAVKSVFAKLTSSCNQQKDALQGLSEPLKQSLTKIDQIQHQAQQSNGLLLGQMDQLHSVLKEQFGQIKGELTEIENSCAQLCSVQNDCRATVELLRAVVRRLASQDNNPPRGAGARQSANVRSWLSSWFSRW